MTMAHRIAKTAIVLVAGSVAILARQDPQALQRMVATERAFAAATAEIGVRDGFLTFFADDAISLAAGKDGASATAKPAKEGLRALTPPKLPLLSQLMWEPFTGHVSSDGTLGWLTGGYANLTLTTRDLVGRGAYFSVWKHQADGTWRVWLDEGITLPTLWNDASPFRVAPEPDAGTAGEANETIDAAEQAVASGGNSWRARLSADVRLHRNGRMPLVGRDAAVEWAGHFWRSLHYTVIKQEVAGSADLGVTVGGYDATTDAGAEHGTWVRVWKRDVTGRWRIVFETSKSAS
jgi:hypothetical protein